MKYYIWLNMLFIVVFLIYHYSCNFIMDNIPSICKECVQISSDKLSDEKCYSDEDFELELDILKKDNKMICNQIYIYLKHISNSGISFLKNDQIKNKNNNINKEINSVLNNYDILSNIEQKLTNDFIIISLKKNETEISLFSLTKDDLDLYLFNHGKYNKNKINEKTFSLAPIFSNDAFSFIDKENFNMKAFLISYFSVPLNSIGKILRKSGSKENIQERINTFVIFENQFLKDTMKLKSTQEIDIKIALNDIKSDLISLHDYFDNVFISRNNIKISNDFKSTKENIIKIQFKNLKKLLSKLESDSKYKDNLNLPRFSEVRSNLELSVESFKYKFNNTTQISNISNCFNNTPNTIDKYMNTFSCIRKGLKNNDELSNLTRNEIDEKLQRYFSFMKSDISFKDLLFRKKSDRTLNYNQTLPFLDYTIKNDSLIREQNNDNMENINVLEFDKAFSTIKMNISTLFSLMKKNCNTTMIKNTKCFFYLDFIDFIIESAEINKVSINNNKIITLTENSLKLYDIKKKEYINLSRNMLNANTNYKNNDNIFRSEVISNKISDEQHHIIFHIEHSNIILMILIFTLSISIFYLIYNNSSNKKIGLSDEILIEYPRILNILFYNDDSYFKIKYKDEFEYSKYKAYKLPPKEELRKWLKLLKERFQSDEFLNYQKLKLQEIDKIDNENLDGNSSFNSNLDSKSKNNFKDEINTDNYLNYIAFNLKIAIDEITLVFNQYDRLNSEKNIKSFIKSNVFCIFLFSLLKVLIYNKVMNDQIIIWICFSIFGVIFMIFSQLFII